MSFIGDAIGDVFGGITGANQQADAAQAAAQTQSASAQAGIDEQRRQFDAIQALLAPYVGAGTSALGAQGDLLGLNGADKQAAAITALQGSPQFQALTQQGENAILQNASATGGLRGGNTQSALAQFRPSLLSQLIEQQYSRLGGLSSLGQNAAAGVGNAGTSASTNIANLLQQQGAALAGGQLAAGSSVANTFNTLLQGGAAAAGAYFSDRRLKRNVRPIGRHASGLTLYAWTYLWGEPATGVMADEAQVLRPQAVFAGPGGYLMVDYSKL